MTPRWIAESLNRKFALVVFTAMAIASLLFLLFFVGIYQRQLERERSAASLQVNRLLQASLENAMLKRDLGGLRQIVERLGAQEDIRQVMITNPRGEVRFSSHPDLLGQELAWAPEEGGFDRTAGTSDTELATLFTVNEQGHEVLRSVNPVRNKEPCTECHGAVLENPVNGVLFVDYDAAPVLMNARNSALLLAGSGGLVALVTLAVAAWFLRRSVLSPIERLAYASRSLAGGRLDARVAVKGRDELGRLGDTFNEMARKLQRIQQEIRHHEQFLQGFIDAIPDGVRVIDQDFKIVNANRAYREQLGLGPTEVVGRPCYKSSHNREQPCPPTLVTCPLHELQRSDEPIKAIHQHIRKDGTALQVEVYAAPMTVRVNGDDQVMIVESVRDLTSHIKISQEQRLAEMDQLASGVAHEIHNPLASIRLALQAALRTKECQQEEIEQIFDYLTTMDGEIDQCIDITERLLKLGEPPGERPELVEINAAIADTLSLLRYEAESLGVTLETDLDVSEPRVLAADSEVRMLVLNVTQNAFHAMPEGGRLRVTSSLRGNRVLMTFEDTGVGIAPGDLMYIFDPFFSHRADGARGTGLGLTICRSIVERYNGTVDVESQVGEGTKFVITLPNVETLDESVGHGYREPEHFGC